MEDGQLELVVGKEGEINPKKDFKRWREVIDGQFPLGVAFPPTEDGEFYAVIICEPRRYETVVSQIAYSLAKSGGGFYIKHRTER